MLGFGLPDVDGQAGRRPKCNLAKSAPAKFRERKHGSLEDRGCGDFNRAVGSGDWLRSSNDPRAPKASGRSFHKFGLA